jgi:hypothetical protein
MSRELSSEDRLLALLERTPAPLEISDICALLAWSRQRVWKAVNSLVAAHRLRLLQGERNGNNGRPSDRVALPAHLSASPSGRPGRKGLPLEENTVVVTPTNEDAIVTGCKNGFATVRYITGTECGHTARIHVDLLNAYVAGQPRPAPVRIEREQVHQVRAA